MLENAPEIVNILILSTVAGLLSSVLGGLIVIFVVGPSKKFIGLSFTFAAAVLLTLVFVDFIPHAIGHGHYHTAIDPATGIMYQYWFQHGGAGIWLTVIGVLVGVGLIALLSLFDTHGHEHIHGVLPHNEHCSHQDNMTPAEKRRIAAAAFPVAFAIILHDLPKGLAIGSSGTILAALAIGLSCVPEGMSIAIPLKAGGVKRRKIIGVCALAGLATILGAVIGYLVGGINVYLSGIMFAVAAGCILGVVFTEIMPLAVEYTGRSRLKLPVMVAGVLLVVALNYFFHNLAH
ncbi:MAG: ZIP family metal transporter [Defluviitaleaceae bacterium]|nr:ZIP family metal transporter [Defluviitaleaceae bacterium]